jgi:zinc transport system substrate-binding protein
MIRLSAVRCDGARRHMDSRSAAIDMRNIVATSFTLFTLAVLISACGRGEKADGRIVVGVSIPPLAQFVERVGGGNVRTIVMVPPGASPHTYEPKPSQLVELSRAAMYVKVGSPIEFELAWLDKLISVNESMAVVDCSAGIVIEGGRAQGHGQGRSEVDPHIWVSPRNAAIMVATICNGLISIDPQRRAQYEANRDRYIAELEDLDRRIENALAKIENRTLLVYHPAWGYFARRYGLDQLPIEEQGKEPTARNIAALIEKARARNIDVIFASPQFSTETAEVIAKEIGARVVFIDPLQKQYIANLERIVKELEAAGRME